ncbi:MAG: response regulator, partial [Actinomycetes bacterium]
MTLHGAFAAKLEQRRRTREGDLGETGSRGEGGPLPFVLVVDDEPEITRTIADMLRRDYQVLTASSAQEGLELLRANSVAVILTDQRMPGGTGAELLAHALDVSPETTRILFTGYSDISAVIDAVNEGQVYRYMTKPWRPDELRAAIGQGLDRYRLVLENRRLFAE